MKKQVLFIQGGGKEGYQVDAGLVSSLQKTIGEDYKINYPRMHTDEGAPDFGWLKQIGNEINKQKDGVVVVAHSLGASLLLKYLSENTSSKKIAGIFLLAPPFWSGREDWVQGLKLKEGFAQNLPGNTPLFFYHCRDDEEVRLDQLAVYRHKLPLATFREMQSGGHQFDNHLNLVATDIKALG